MWGGLLALGICVRRTWKHFASAETFVVLLYAANLAQWAVTPRAVTYYYYYFSAAMFLGAAIAVALKGIPRPRIFGIRLAFITLWRRLSFFSFGIPDGSLNPPWDCLFGCWSQRTCSKTISSRCHPESTRPVFPPDINLRKITKNKRH